MAKASKKKTNKKRANFGGKHFAPFSKGVPKKSIKGTSSVKR